MTIDLNELRRLAESWLPEPGRLAINEERLAEGCIALLDRLAEFESERDAAQHISTERRCEVSDAYMCDDGADDFCMLYGPDGFCCRLGEPEDRIWIRDGRDAVDKLNEQHRAIESLRADRDRLAAEVEVWRTEASRALALATLEGDDADNYEARMEQAQIERDAARAEADRLRAILSLFGLNAAAPIDAIASAAVTLVEDQRGMNALRLAALSEVFSLRGQNGGG